MESYTRYGPVFGAIAICSASFAVGVILMKSDKDTDTDQAPLEVAASSEKKASQENAPNADPVKTDTKKATGTDSGILSVNVPAGWSPPTNQANGLTPIKGLFPTDPGPIGPWKTRSGYGLPNPRKLTSREKSALNMLGKAEAIHRANYTRIPLPDGSTIPGVPTIDGNEAKKRLLDKVALKGLGDGFEEFVREMAIQNPDYIEIAITNQADWEDVEKVLKGTNDASYKKSANAFPIVWRQSGDAKEGDWLSFGLSAGKVRYVKASFPMRLLIGPQDPENAPLIAAELVPGGRSPPDPDKAYKKFKPRPRDAGPPEIEVLQKLGVVKDVKVVFVEGKNTGGKLDSENKKAEEAIDKPLYPDLVGTARKFQRTQVTSLIVTPSKSISLDELTDIMNDTTLRTDDTTTFPGMKVRWYHYSWMEFGIVEGQVKKVRMFTLNIPAKL
jgi:hypothetical protein